MPNSIPTEHDATKHHCVYVPIVVKSAKIELLKVRGAPVFVGTELARLHFDNTTLTVYSKMSGVIDRVLVDNDQLVIGKQELFEIRNTNVIRGRAGNKMEPSPPLAPKPTGKREEPRQKSSDYPKKFVFNFTPSQFSFKTKVIIEGLISSKKCIKRETLNSVFFKNRLNAEKKPQNDITNSTIKKALTRSLNKFQNN